MKKIMVELWFDDHFTPPEHFEDPTFEDLSSSKCAECPMFSWLDDYDIGECILLDRQKVDEGDDLCPIHKYFASQG